MAKIGLPLFRRPQDVIAVTEFARKLVFALDVFQLLERCGAIVFNLDGRVPDDGSVMEAATGWTAGLPVVIVKTTPVTMLGGYDNPMVTGLGMRWAYVSNLEDLASAVAKAVADDQSLGGPPFTPGPHAAAVVTLGREVWTRMPAINTLTRETDPKQILPAVRQLEKDLGPLLVAAGLSDPPPSRRRTKTS